MNRVINAADRHFQDFGWLKTHWLFSFDSYYDPANVHHGVLRVFNDDVVAPGTGFDTHPHREMEIVTIVLEGEITHEDSLGNVGVIRAGEVQRMTAGTGIAHAERNLGRVPVHLYQIWILPDRPRRSPGYDQKGFAADELRDALVPVASNEGAGAISLHADATIYRAILSRGRSVEFAARPGRKLFLYCGEGDVEVASRRLCAGDQLRFDAAEPLPVRALSSASIVLIDAADAR